MNGVVRLGDKISPHCVAAPTVTSSSFTKADGVFVCREGDLVATHITPPCPLPGPPHGPPIAPPSGRFTKADGIPIATITDPVTGCTSMDEGSSFWHAN